MGETKASKWQFFIFIILWNEYLWLSNLIKTSLFGNLTSMKEKMTMSLVLVVTKNAPVGRPEGRTCFFF